MNKWRYHKYVGTPLGALFTTSDEEKIIKFLQKHVQEKGTTPSVRRLCREANISPSKFYALFGSLESLCEKAGVKLDQGTISRISISAKATRKHVRKAERKRSRVQTPAPPVETVNVEPVHTPAFEALMQDSEDKEASVDDIRENAQIFAKELKTLMLDEDPDHRVSLEVYNEVLSALVEVLPVILYCKYDVWAELPDLLSAQDVLKKARKEQKKLRKEQIQLDGERLEIQRARELLKRDSDKKSLLEYLEKLEWQMKVNTKRFNETYDALKRFRVTFRELWKSASKCPNCPKTFMQNMMASHGDILEWITSGKYTRLSFETEGTPKLGYRT